MGAIWWKTSGDCIEDAVEADSMLSGYGGILDNSFSLTRSKLQGTVFMKSRYPVFLDLHLQMVWKVLNSAHWGRQKHFLWTHQFSSSKGTGLNCPPRV